MLWTLEILASFAVLCGLSIAICLWLGALYYTIKILSLLLDILGHVLVRWVIPPVLRVHLLLSGNFTAYLLYTMRDA